MNLTKSLLTLTTLVSINCININNTPKFKTGILHSQNVLNELKSSEDVLKNILLKIFNHLYEYVRYRLLSSFFNFYLINPFNIQLGNLLNTEINNYYLTCKLNIPNYSTPLSFGINYQQVNVNKNFGCKMPNKCWFIKSQNKNAKSAFILMHGWFGNLQSSLPFLNVLNQVGALENNHVLVLNLFDNMNNSFESNIGLKGVADLYDGISYLYKNYNIKNFTVYAQSVSSLSALMLYDYILSLRSPNAHSSGHSDSSNLDGSGADAASDGDSGSEGQNCDVEMLKKVEFDMIILESPVVNIKQYTSDFKYYNQLMALTNNRSKRKWHFCRFDGHLGKLNLAEYLRRNEIRKKVNILQGAKDDVTKLEMLKQELERASLMPNLFLFKKSGHIDLSVHDSRDYLSAVDYILNTNPLFKYLKLNRNQVKSLKQL
ncbi:conserved hypothetical protein [Theileria orientalis strain Shintoku]|uniref:Lipase n=1 Tax=Theileria orientalis strain Shintoku TaxID=869250 RepID=J4D9S3_THEOR|nr:conserved hypothetical protein [Theileria orientalis strain Shintoku]BAM41565.1 conserved hypothetical protein [Theileria orientalis strain Shintoku]|eukprot:XP_009691866.1 conserved hypothetical protein [Theileria orientalis strain Shintoku]